MTESCVCVVDSDASSRQLVAELAAAMLVDCQSFMTAEDLLAAFPRGNAVVVSEFRLLGINGIELQRRLNDASRCCQLIFHTAFAETRLVVTAMQSGAVTVLEKPASEQALWDALRQGLTRGAKLHWLAEQQAELRAQLEKLSKRERLVLRSMLDGRPNKSIARQLDVSVRTVENCRHNIFRKTRTNSIAELVRQIVERAPWFDQL